MKAAVISLGSISSRWVAVALREHFETVDELDLKDIEVELGLKNGGVLYQGKPLEKYDCIYAKGSFRFGTLLRAITSYLSPTTYMPVNERAFTASHNKLIAHLRLQAGGVPTPKTYIVATADAGKKLLKKLQYPLIIKLPSGTHGKGVMYADSIESATSMIDALALLRQPFLLQEYVETGGTDTRAIVVGNSVVAGMIRSSAPDDKRSNLHSGGEATPVSLDAVTKNVAIKASRALECEICGVDILQTPKGPLVLEVNVSPGFQCVTNATGINVAQKVAKYLFDQTVAFKKVKNAGLLDDVKKEEPVPAEGKEILTTIDFRGERIILPVLASKISALTEGEEVMISVQKGSIIVKKK